jgi:hypothetical protein
VLYKVGADGEAGFVRKNLHTTGSVDVPLQMGHRNEVKKVKKAHTYKAVVQLLFSI